MNPMEGSLAPLGLGLLIFWVRTKRGHQGEKGRWGEENHDSARASTAAYPAVCGQHHL